MNRKPEKSNIPLTSGLICYNPIKLFYNWLPISDINRNSGIGSHLTNRHVYMVLLADVIIFIAAHMVSYLIRFEFVLSSLRIQQIFFTLPLIIPIKLITFYWFGLYRGMWRYTSSQDIWHLLQVVAFITLLILTPVLFINHFHGYSRGVFLLDGLFTFLFSAGLRISIRAYISQRDRREQTVSFSSSNRTEGPTTEPIRTLIIGAGNAGAQIIREIHHNSKQQYTVVGFLDDQKSKLGRSIYGRRILGTVDELRTIAKNYKIDLVLIAIPSANVNQLSRIVQSCERIEIKCRTLPSLTEIIDGNVSVNDFRKINYQDLLRRAPVELDWENISDYLSNTTILVTGCGGSIGSELCRQILRFNPREMILVDASEENLFKIQTELHHERNFFNYQTILARIQNRSLMEKIFDKYRPQVVFHAAANKHVPIMEVNPWEAVYNNIRASLTAMELAVKYKVKRFVLVSTDKAVHPANVMGASKRVTELLLQSFQGTDTRFMAVRFGNVIGSSGSVIPLFERQLKNGGPITVTHPEITRYFMTIPEASQLILQAGSMGKGGEIFILDMGEPVKIVELAKEMVRLSGKEPDKDIEITYTGLREGEKMHEELKMKDENVLSTAHKKIVMLKTNGSICGFQDRNDFKLWLYKKIDELNGTALTMDSVAIKRKLKEIVYEYSPQDTTCVL